MRGDETAAGRPADLHRLKFRISLDAAADIKDNFLQCRSHRHFNETGVLHTSGQGKRLGSRTLLRPDGLVPDRSIGNDHRHIGKGLHVIEYRRFREKPLLHSPRRLHSRHAPLSFNRCGQRASLAADKGSRTPVNM